MYVLTVTLILLLVAVTSRVWDAVAGCVWDVVD
jgi:hypothetical protein